MPSGNNNTQIILDRTQISSRRSYLVIFLVNKMPSGNSNTQIIVDPTQISGHRSYLVKKKIVQRVTIEYEFDCI